MMQCCIPPAKYDAMPSLDIKLWFLGSSI